ncbi:hypothetical protein [Cohnella sp. GCM10027633]|uniref:hypothetical protein n=1 Tax=unclassified Cohnella TaxID=2636738 RepID=UPI00363F332C
MRYVIVCTGIVALAITLAIRRRSKTGFPAGPTYVAYGIALALDSWYALNLPIPSLSAWATWLLKPMADAFANFLN